MPRKPKPCPRCRELEDRLARARAAIGALARLLRDCTADNLRLHRTLFGRRPRGKGRKTRPVHERIIDLHFNRGLSYGQVRRATGETLLCVTRVCQRERRRRAFLELVERTVAEAREKYPGLL